MDGSGRLNRQCAPYLFTDQEHDPETDLQYFGARYYDPWVERFLSQDPELIGAHAGGTFAAIADDAQQYNSYSYVTNRPTALVDPNGRQSFKDVMQKVKDVAKEGVGKQVEKLAEKLESKFNTVNTGGDVVGQETIPAPSVGDVADAVVADQGSRTTGESATGTSNAETDTVGSVPVPPTGKGAAPPSERDPQRVFSPNQKEEMRQSQGGQCAGDCGTGLGSGGGIGHHNERHADGGRTAVDNGSLVCPDCHKKLHSARAREP